jgi:hypothetical protein
MVMKKASGGDSPLQQGAEKSFWTLPISGQRRRWLTICFWKIDRVFRVFSLRRIYRQNGGIRRWARWPHHLVVRARGRPRHPMVRLAPGSPPSLLRTPSRVGKNRYFSFCFVQFQEYFLCSFSETQKQQKTGN